MKKNILLLFVLFSSLGHIYAQGGWSQNLNFTGAARTFPSTFTIGTDVYMGLGLKTIAPQSPCKDFWKFNPTTGTWSQMADFGGLARWAGYGFSIDGKGYAGNGRDSVPNSFNDHWEYDTTTNSWTQKANFPGATRRGCAAASYNGKGYVGMGWDGTNYYDDWYEYDPTNDTWTQKASYPFGAINYPCAFTLGDQIYVGTGYNATTYSSNFCKYDQATDSWNNMNGISGSGRYGAAAFVVGGYAYVGTGGTQNNTPFTDFWRYDTATGDWTQMSDMPGATRYCAAFSYGGKGYVALGDSNNALRTYIWTFDTTSIYTQVSNANLCPKTTNTVQFTTTDSLDPSNMFILEISDSSGDFTFPTALDTVYGNVSDSFVFDLPSSLPAGVHYLMRTRSSLPSINGYVTSQYISINQAPIIVIPGSTSQSFCGNGSIKLAADTSYIGVNYESFYLDIIYDATKGQSTLSNSDKVYMHSGTTDTTITGTTWSNIVGNYGQDDGIGKMDSLGNDLWKISIDVSKYYSLGYGYGAKYIAMTFRNGDGTKTGKSSSNDDIYINIYNGNVINSTSNAVSASFRSGYQWLNANGVIAGANGPVYQASTTGDYKLVVSGICSDTSQTYSVQAFSSFNSGYILSASSVCLGTAINFDDTTSSNSNGSRLWNFGDGSNTSQVKSPSHTYSAAGNYTVTLYLYYAGGCVDSVKKNVTVNPNPTASINAVYNNTQCESKNVYSFIDASSAAGGAIASRSWNYGDGFVDTASNSNHSYTSAGAYKMTLIVTSDKGCIDSASLNLTINPSVKQNMFINAITQCLTGNSFSFIDSSTISSGTISQHDWDFGDGNNSSNTISPSHSYTTAGSYQVKLINATNLGCADTLIRTVTVVNKPTASVSPASVQPFCQGGSVTLKTSSNTGYTYQWFKNGTAITGANADSIVVSDSGDYHVTIQVPGGCGDTSKSVTIKVKPKVTLSSISGKSLVMGTMQQSYTVAKMSGVTYNWIVTGGVIQSGQGTDSIVVLWSVGTGKVKVYAECADTVSLDVTITLGISNNKLAQLIHIYPNPTKDVLTIDASNIAQTYTLKLVDIHGKQLMIQNKNTGITSLDLSQLPAGIYIVEWDNQQDIYRQMIIKE